jgi:NAD(P)-dependent dehydrogenase (short-subunit alcohol dehydrogenase family)
MSNKVALITGGSRGIGLGIAKSLAKEGWDLAINGIRDESEVGASLDMLKEDNVQVKYVQGNIGSRENRRQIVKETIDYFGSINALVNNAGVAPKERNDLLDMSEESYDRVLNINLKGTFFLTQLVAKEMISMNYELRPGLILTDMTSGVREKYDKLINEGLVLQQKWGEPSDIGKVVVSLVNENLAYSTGQVIMIDGGMSISRL